jgi:hypothetical protein
MKRITSEEIDYHSARLLLLIAYCGSPERLPNIKGRTLLAKLDFFIRYPTYLDKAAYKQTGKHLDELTGELLKEEEKNNVETRMIRYRYGPWDKLYYQILIYLISKNLINVEIQKEVELFGLTNTGKQVVELLSNNPVFRQTILRAKVLKKIFPRWSGSGIKNFIYESFPEIISLPLGEEIE